MEQKDKIRFDQEMEKTRVINPKRPLTAYILFVKDEFQKLKSQNTDRDPAIQFKQISKKWKYLTDEEKQPYIEQNRKDKERYFGQKEKLPAFI